LDKIWVVLDLEDSGLDASVALEVKEQSAVIVTVEGESFSILCGDINK
jgi:hypothetical protein